MRFRVLGNLQIRDGAAWSSVQAAQQRLVLAVLLTEAGRAVSTDRLIEEIWGERPPRAALVTVQGYVSRLRRLLGGPGDTLVTRGRGYQLLVEDGDLDANLFEQLVASGRRSLAEGGREAAVARLSEALGLWAGPALADVPPTPTIAAHASRLEQIRLDALEQRLAAMLELGCHAEAAGELGQLVDEQPLRERLWGLFMLALHGCGRRAEALLAYQRARQTLVVELGVEPGAELRELHRTMLADDRRQAAAPGPVGLVGGRVKPAQLPADVAGFTGRTSHLQRLDALLSEDGDPSSGLTIATISGAPGVGKTALAVHWAHLVRDRFPDGQLYLNLRGYAAGRPLRPIDALARFLPALGVPAREVPDEVDRAAALYRSVLADRRVLMLLDNANHADQVRPLLPGGPGCLVVTSRDRLAGLAALDGAVPLHLDLLAPAESLRLLTRLLRADHRQAEPEALAELADLCGHLPLALRIAAASLCTQPGHCVADYVARLRGDRLTALAVEGEPQAGIRTTFDLSYSAQPAPARRLFRLLGMVPGPDITVPAAAALAGVSPDRTGRVLDQLTDAHLVHEHTAGRYVLHDLMRLYAAEQANVEDGRPVQHAARDRLYHHYLGRIDAAARLLYPDKLRLPLPAAGQAESFDDSAAALAWLDAERANLVAAAHQAAARGPHWAAWQLADALRGYFDLRMDAVDWLAAAQAGLAAADAEHDQRAQAAAHISLAGLHWQQARYQPALDHYTAALRLTEQAGWHGGLATALGNLGNVYADLGYLHKAADHHTRALAIDRQTGWRPGQATKLANLGEVYHGLGCLDEALTTLTQALAVRREAAANSSESETVRALAAVHRDAGNYADALHLATAALAAARDKGAQRHIANALNTLATVHHHLGRHDEAIHGHQQALSVARVIDSRYAQTQALTGLTDAGLAAGQAEQPMKHAQDALVTAHATGSLVLQGQALTALAAVHLELGHHEKALALTDQAQALHLRTGHRLGRARTHLIAAHARASIGHAGQARCEHDAAKALFAAAGVPPEEHERVLFRRATTAPGR